MLADMGTMGQTNIAGRLVWEHLPVMAYSWPTWRLAAEGYTPRCWTVKALQFTGARRGTRQAGHVFLDQA